MVILGFWGAHGEARRDFEGAGEETGLDVVDADAAEGEALVEARVAPRAVRTHVEPRDQLRCFFFHH